MTCGELRRILSEGLSLSNQAEEHLRSCAGCRNMLNASAMRVVDPDPQRLVRLQEQIRESLTPVRPLPSDRILVPGLAALVLLFAIAASFAVGHEGFSSLSATQRVTYYSVIVLVVLACSRMVVGEAIPGARRLSRPYLLVGFCAALLSLTVMALFGNFNVDHFVHFGLPCLSIGTAAAAVAALLLWKPVTRGFFGSPARAGFVVGTLCGLAGIGVLAIFCPFQNSPHILVWHFGAMLIAATVGAAIGVMGRSN